MRFTRLLTLGTATAALAAAPLLADAHMEAAPDATAVTMTAEDVLAPYYAKLAGSVELPVAPTNATLSPDATITRLAFGSCSHQLRPQAYWNTIAATDPDIFLFIGDNNYGDNGWSGDASLASLREAYGVMAATPELAAFRAAVPMMVTWDDHDYGMNDAGGDFAFRTWSETIFETFWGSSDEVRERPGVYEARMFGAEGQRVQVIVLDTRFFRSELETMPYSLERPPMGPYVPSDDASKTMLGEAQWKWLEAELAKPADLRIIASSVQVITDAHDYENWENLPLERQKLYRMLAGREESGMVLLSGDRHAGGIYTDKPEAAGGEQIWELTSSSLNYSFSSTERNTAREPDDKRVTDFISEENFGLIDIDWKARTFTMTMLGAVEGEERVTRTVGW